MSFQYPFIYFGDLGVKYSLVIFYFLVMIGLIICCSYNKIYKAKFQYSKGKTITTFLAYVSLIPFYWLKDLSARNEFLVNLFQSMLGFEFIFIVIIFSIIAYGLLVYVNNDAYLNALNTPITIIIYIDIFLTIVTRQVDFLKWYNIVTFILLGVFIWCMNSITLEKNSVIERNGGDNSVKYYSPIENIEDLFEIRKFQAEHLENLINNHEANESLSICISGEWGNGKTSFVSVVLNELNKNENKRHKIVRINTMDMDSMESLFKYLFQRIKDEFKKENYYVGIWSEFQDYISSIIEVISKAKIKSNIIKSLFEKEKDYRETKKYLEKMLKQMLGENKLIIVVDDIERCDNDKIIQFINFIKEIATFKNCIIIFLTDYNQLENSLDKPIEYIDKYFNHIINLATVSYKDIVNYFTYKNLSNLKLSLNIPISILSEIDKWISEILTEISIIEKKLRELNPYAFNSKEKNGEVEKANLKINLLNEEVLFIQNKLSNPRTASKLFVYINEQCKIINKELQNKCKNRDVVEKYLNKVEAARNIVIISFIRSVMPEKYDYIQTKGFNNYVDFLCDVNSIKEFEDELINSLVSGLWYKEYFKIAIKEYKHDEIMKFMTCLFETPHDLDKVVNGFTSYDDKYITLIDNENFEDIDIDFIELFSIIMKNYSYVNSDKGANLLGKLFDNAEQVIEDESGKEYAFNIFDSSSGATRYCNPKLTLMQLFYEKICNENIILNNLNKVKEELNLFCRNYMPKSFSYLNKILLYHLIDNDNIDVIMRAKEKSQKEISFNEILDIFCEELKTYFKSSGNTPVENIKGFVNECKEELINMDFLKEEDIKNDLDEALAQITEYEYLEKIIQFISGKQSVVVEDLDLKNTIFVNIENKVNDFMNKLKTDMSESFKYKSPYIMQEFFITVRQLGEDNAFSDELINKLMNLISVFKECSKTDVNYYRRVMFHIKKSSKKKGEDINIAN